MRLEIKIKKIGSRLGIIIPRSVITNARLGDGDVLNIHIEDNKMIITSDDNKSALLDRVTVPPSVEDIFSRTLRDNQLILAK